MGYYSDITGRIEGINEKDYDEMSEVLSEVFEEVYWNNDNSISIESYGRKHYEMDEIYNLIASKTTKGGELEYVGEENGDISIIFFAPGKWKELDVKIVYPENPFKE